MPGFFKPCAAAIAPALLFLCACAPRADEAALQLAIDQQKRIIELPAATIELHQPLHIPAGAKSMEIRGNPAGSTLRLAADFKGKAGIIANEATAITLRDFTIEGNRGDLHSPLYLPPDGTPFATYYDQNGILISSSQNIRMQDITLRRVRNFAILINASSNVQLERVTVEDSGTLGPNGKNNTTGGILFEEGVRDFQVANSSFRDILGNAVWTHSYSASPRNSNGIIHRNEFLNIARDAIQVGHATGIKVTNNHGDRIGFPAEFVDAEHHGTPVALDTAGNVDKSIYRENTFTNTGGQCINLDGFHSGEVINNTCKNSQPFSQYPYLHYGILFGNNDPTMTSTAVTIRGNVIDGFAYGGLFLIGSGHTVENNKFLNTNRARCTGAGTSAVCNYMLDQPGLLRSGIYLGVNGGRPTRTENNIIRNNTVEGFRNLQWCIDSIPGVALSRNTIANNTCRADSAP